jgi:hypothetical protein
VNVACNCLLCTQQCCKNIPNFSQIALHLPLTRCWAEGQYGDRCCLVVTTAAPKAAAGFRAVWLRGGVRGGLHVQQHVTCLGENSPSHGWPTGSALNYDKVLLQHHMLGCPDIRSHPGSGDVLCIIFFAAAGRKLIAGSEAK